MNVVLQEVGRGGEFSGISLGPRTNHHQNDRQKNQGRDEDALVIVLMFFHSACFDEGKISRELFFLSLL